MVVKVKYTDPLDPVPMNRDHRYPSWADSDRISQKCLLNKLMAPSQADRSGTSKMF